MLAFARYDKICHPTVVSSTFANFVQIVLADLTNGMCHFSHFKTPNMSVTPTGAFDVDFAMEV